MSAPLSDEPTTLLPALPAHQHRWWGRRQFIVPAVVVLTVLVVAGAGWLLLTAPPSGRSAAPTASNPSPQPSHRGGHGIRGAIVSESGSTWTVRTSSGRTVSVLITAQTRFGTVKKPQTRADFPVGTPVLVAGTLDGGTITATRITTTRPRPSTSPTSSATA